MGGTTSTPQPVTTVRTTTTLPNASSRNGLTRMYGYFKCSGCRQLWESSHVYCKQGTSTASYGQECKSCREICKPYRVEKIVCSGCGETNCVCTQKRERHIDPNKHHRSDLCAKCKAGLPCTGRF